MNHILYICFFLFISVKTYGMYDGHNLCITNDTTICDMPDLQPQCMGIEDHNKISCRSWWFLLEKHTPI